MDICRLPFGMAPGSQQADLRISPRPEAKTIKPTVCLFILFQPDKGHRLIAEAPRLYEPQGLRELWESRPQKKCAVRGGQISHRERTQLVNPHCGIMVFCRPLYLIALVLPRGISVNNGILFYFFTLLLHMKKPPVFLQAVQWFVIYSSVVLSPNKIRM